LPENGIVHFNQNLPDQSPGLYAAEKPMKPPLFTHLLISNTTPRFYSLSLVPVCRESCAIDLVGLQMQPNQFKEFYALTCEENQSTAEESDLRSVPN